jgi:hypothetical protein
MKAYGEWMYDPHFLYLGTSWKEPPVLIGQEVGCTSEPVWTIWRSENSLPHRDSNSDFSVIQPVASRYTVYAIPAPHTILIGLEICKFNRIKHRTPFSVILFQLEYYLNYVHAELCTGTSTSNLYH